MRKNNAPLLLRFVKWIFPRLEKTLPRLAQRFFVWIFFTPLNYSVPSKEKAFERSAEYFHVYAGGKRIQCYGWGKGPTVLVVHGWAGRATQFRKIIAALVENGFRVVGFDGPAHGRSQGRSTNVLEFDDVLRKIYEKVGIPQGIIAHSFGGSAVLYAAMNGLSVKKLVNIASPTIGDEIIGTYLKAIGGSSAIRDAFKAHVLKKTGKPFEAFTSLHFVQHLEQPVDLLLVHDEDDVEVSINHAIELIKIYPKARLFRTSRLGHTRILRDENVIHECLSFIRSTVHP